MSLWTPRSGCSALEDNFTANAGTSFGTSITCAGSTHTKSAFSAGQLIAATAYESYGITIFLSTIATLGNMLVDIGIGASGSESVLISNLMCGRAQDFASASAGPMSYTFPIYIPAGARLAAAAQSNTASNTVRVQIHLHQNSIGVGGWIGGQVTTYGANTGTSSGTSHTGGNSAYATTTQLTASSTAPVRYLQVGLDILTDTTGITLRNLLRIAAGSSTNYIVSDLPYRESTTVEWIDNTHINFVLSNMMFDFPTGTYLGVGAQTSGTGEARGFVLYAVS